MSRILCDKTISITLKGRYCKEVVKNTDFICIGMFDSEKKNGTEDKCSDNKNAKIVRWISNMTREDKIRYIYIYK